MAPDRASPPRLRAIGLLSEGIDGVLAARLLEEAGAEVDLVHFRTGFARGESPRGSDRPGKNPASPYDPGFRSATGLAGPLTVVDVAREYLESVVLAPRHGYGSAFNPCIDCRIFMVRKAEEIRRARGADVVATGEILGQDRMRQKRATLRTIEEEAGASGRLLRPLSALRLEETQVEKERRIDRARLGSFHGRARRDLAALARTMGIADPPPPTDGCCLLADAGFARRLRDLVSHRDIRSITTEDLLLLRVGRHLRLAHDLKVIFGRDEAESAFLSSRASGRWTCQVASGRGALGLVEGEAEGEAIERVARLAVRYSSERSEESASVVLRREGEERRVLAAAAVDPDRFLL